MNPTIADLLREPLVVLRTPVRGMVFEGVARSQLEALGEAGTPSVADLFVALMQGGQS